MSHQQQHGPQIEPTSANETPTPEGKKPQRGPDGRFVRGNDGGPGNPFTRQVAEMRRTMLQRATPEAMNAVVDGIIEKATKGDMAAAKLFLLYCVGKPTEAPNPDYMDLDELTYFRREAGMMQFASTVPWEPDPSVVLTLMRAARHAATNRVARFSMDEIGKMDGKTESGVRSAESGVEGRGDRPMANGGNGGESGVRGAECGVEGRGDRPMANGGNGERGEGSGFRGQDDGPMANGGNGGETGVRGAESGVRGGPAMTREEFAALREQVRQKEEARRLSESQKTPSANGKHPAVKK